MVQLNAYRISNRIRSNVNVIRVSLVMVCVVVMVRDERRWRIEQNVTAVLSSDKDINECVHSPCHANAICTNTYGNFTCECKRNYIGNGFFCKPIHDEGERWAVRRLNKLIISLDCFLQWKHVLLRSVRSFRHVSKIHKHDKRVVSARKAGRWPRITRIMSTATSNLSVNRSNAMNITIVTPTPTVWSMKTLRNTSAYANLVRRLSARCSSTLSI